LLRFGALRSAPQLPIQRRQIASLTSDLTVTVH
jgi:hypothetical protein